MIWAKIATVNKNKSSFHRIKNCRRSPKRRKAVGLTILSITKLKPLSSPVVRDLFGLKFGKFSIILLAP